MALDNFIPSVWAARVQRGLEARYVYAGLTNRDYEGEIREAGDTVNINSIGDVTINDYVKYSTTVTPEQLSSTQKQLLIDQQKYFAFYVDDVDAAQTQPKVMDEAVRKSSRGLAEVADDYIKGIMDSNAGISGPLAETLDTTNVADYMGTINQQLDENDNDPDEDRWIVVPPWLKKLIVISFQGNTESTQVMENGRVGRYYGLNVFMSNRVPADTGDDVILAGTNRGVTMAEQIVSTEAYRPESSFSDAVKGLHVYGATTVLPNAILRSTASEDTST